MSNPRRFYVKEQIFQQFAEGTYHIASTFNYDGEQKILAVERIENECVRCHKYTSLFNHDYHIYVCDDCSPNKREEILRSRKEPK
jgi:Zn finger protein HypA/HybF involved in hydrogenase expression